MMLRVFLGAVAGTMINLGFFGWLTALNGTPVPSARTPTALLAYPTGSVTATLVVAWAVYFTCLLVSCVLIPRRTR